MIDKAYFPEFRDFDNADGEGKGSGNVWDKINGTISTLAEGAGTVLNGVANARFGSSQSAAAVQAAAEEEQERTNRGIWIALAVVAAVIVAMLLFTQKKK